MSVSLFHYCKSSNFSFAVHAVILDIYGHASDEAESHRCFPGSYRRKTSLLVGDGLCDGSSKKRWFHRSGKAVTKVEKQKEKHLKRIVSSAFCWSC